MIESEAITHSPGISGIGLGGSILGGGFGGVGIQSCQTCIGLTCINCIRTGLGGLGGFGAGGIGGLGAVSSFGAIGGGLGIGVSVDMVRVLQLTQIGHWCIWHWRSRWCWHHRQRYRISYKSFRSEWRTCRWWNSVRSKYNS